MSTPQILNVIAIVFFGVSVILGSSVLIYISIGCLIASIVYWRIKANKSSRE